MKKSISYTKPAIDIEPAQRYRLSRFYIDTLAPFMPSEPDAHRLFHALLYLTFQAQDDRSGPPSQPAEGFSRRCVDIRDLLGLNDSRCNRVLARGRQELLESGNFEFLEFAQGNAWLWWRFDDAALRACLDQDEYAVLDAGMLKSLRSVADFNVHAQVALCRRMARPRFETNLDDIGISVGNRTLTWSQHSKAFLRALQAACAHYGLSGYVYLGEHISRRGIRLIEVRLDYPGSAWSRADLRRIGPEVRRIIHVDGSGHREVPLPATRTAAMDRVLLMVSPTG